MCHFTSILTAFFLATTHFALFVHAFQQAAPIAFRSRSQISLKKCSGAINGMNTNQNILTSNQCPDTILSYKNNEFDDEFDAGSVSTNKATPEANLPLPETAIPKKKSRVSRVVRSTTTSKPTNIKLVETLDALRALEMEHKGGNRLMIVKFFMHSCKSCKAIEPMYKRLARKNPQVTFASVELTKHNQDLVDALDIESVPFGHIYHPSSGLVEELKMGKKYWSDFEDAFRSYLTGYCDVSNFDYSSPRGKRMVHF